MSGTNFMCMFCGWRWFVLPKHWSKKEWRRCQACGSYNTKGDHEND